MTIDQGFEFAHPCSPWNEMSKRPAVAHIWAYCTCADLNTPVSHLASCSNYDSMWYGVEKIGSDSISRRLSSAAVPSKASKGALYSVLLVY